MACQRVDGAYLSSRSTKEAILIKRKFRFQAVRPNGKKLRMISRQCILARAQREAFDILRKTPEAGAVFAEEENGRATYSTYRQAQS